MHKVHEIAIVFKDLDRLRDARLYRDLLLQWGAKVAVYCLCDPRDQGQVWCVPLTGGALHKGSAHNDDLAGIGARDRISIECLAEQLKNVDWVIPL